MNKSTIIWLNTRNWCEMNPDKTAAIVTPNGTFQIKFVKKIEKNDNYTVHEFDESKNWIEKYFLE